MQYYYFVLLIREVHLLLVEGGLAPDIDLEGNAFTHNNLTVFQFRCSTNIAVWQCTVEFLEEERTIDDFRYVENTCYHKEGICSPDICKCSKTCESFEWNITVTPDMMMHSFSCGSRMKTDGVIYLANISVKWDAVDGFRLFKKIVIPFDIVSQPQQSTTFPPEEGTDFKISDGVIVILATVGSIVFILICLAVLFFCFKKRCKDYGIKKTTRQDTITAGRSSEKEFSSYQVPIKDLISLRQGQGKVQHQKASTAFKTGHSARFKSGLKSSSGTDSSTSGDVSVIRDSSDLISNDMKYIVNSYKRKSNS